MKASIPNGALPKSLTDNRLWLAEQLAARATIGRGGTIHYNNDDAAIDEMAAEILRMGGGATSRMPGTSNIRLPNAGCGRKVRAVLARVRQALAGAAPRADEADAPNA